MQTENVRIRPYRVEDAEMVVQAVRESVSDLQPWMPWAHPGYSIEESRTWLETRVPAFEQGTAFEFAILSRDGRYLGGCGLNEIERMNRRANLGYWVRSSATRRGVATAAVLALREWAFEATDLLRLEIVVAVGNVASQRVAQKVGAVREGTLRRRLVLHGTAMDATMFSLTRDI
jgi:ribosomal-protein-serine acetyltransferase